MHELAAYRAEAFDLEAFVAAVAAIVGERRRRYPELRGEAWATLAEVAHRAAVDEQLARSTTRPSGAAWCATPPRPRAGRRAPRSTAWPAMRNRDPSAGRCPSSSRGFSAAATAPAAARAWRPARYLRSPPSWL